MVSQKWRPQMTDSERKRGWVFFGLYLLVFPWLMGWLQKVFTDGEPMVAEANVLYYALLFTLSLLVFWSFLRHAFSLLIDWLPENFFAILTGLAGYLVTAVAVYFIPLPVPDLIPLDYGQQFLLAPGPTVVVAVLLMPLVEEVLFRGLMFGSLRRYSRSIAYAVTIPLYALALVWQYCFHPTGLDLRYLLLAVRYLPMSAALAWCYDNGGSVWGAVLLHMAINGITLFAAVH